MTRRVLGVVAVLAMGAGTAATAAAPSPLRVGSKQFTESVILGEILASLARDAGLAVEHSREMGGTRVLWDALAAGQIDMYPEYTGTITREILAGEDPASLSDLPSALRRHGILLGPRLGFDNTYVLGMKEGRAEELGVRTISDLRRHPDLRIGVSSEFLDRGDGWRALVSRYELPHRDVRGLQHDLAYRALDSGAIDVTDLYATDAEIAHYALRALRDDRRHFPSYDAVVLVRADTAARHPALVAALARIAGRITETEMIAMNARAKIDGIGEAEVAAGFLTQTLGTAVTAQEEGAPGRLWRRTREHLALVATSLLAAVLVAIPLGILAARHRGTGHVVLLLVGVVQTVPTLALLVFMIPLLGIGFYPSVAALFLYSLLPIVRNTHAGLVGLPLPILESAEALGLPPLARLRLVELPLASPAILAGIKTSAVINVGTATLGALIGAGGFGQPILTGIRLDDVGLILEGAVPAALLALAAQAFFDAVERHLVPRGLRLARG